MKFSLAHTNINVTDLERSIRFYQDALGLTVLRRKKHPQGEFEIVFLTDEAGAYALELTWLKNHPQPYALGDNEGHIAFITDDFETAHLRHLEMGVICYENTAMGIYFIEDPDGYWLEIVPKRS